MPDEIALKRALNTPVPEGYFRSLIENALDVITVLDRRGIIRYESPSITRILGYLPEELTGTNVFAYVHPEDRLSAMKVYAKGLLHSDKAYTARLRYRHKSGDWRMLECVGQYVKDRSGARVIINSRDITERLDMQRRLDETMAMYEQILDAISDMILVKGPGSRIRWANKAFRDYYGMTNDQLQDIIDAPFNAPDDTQHDVKDDASVFETGRRLDIASEPVKRYDGKVRHFHTVKSTIKNAGGHVVMTVGVSRDVSERKQADELRGMLASIIENSIDAIFSHTLDGVILSWNPTAERLYAYRQAEIIGRSVDLLVPTDRRQEMSDLIAKVRQGEHIPPFETVRRHKEGTLLDVSLALSPIRDPEKRIIGASVIARDMTERKHLQRMILQTEKLSAVGRLAAGVAHEINNPLTVMLGYAEASLKRLPADDPLFQSLQAIVRESSRCKQLVQNLLTFSRERMPGFKMENPCEVIREALALVEHQARLKKVDVITDVSQDSASVWMDRAQVQQVLINLCSNAIDAMPAGGRLAICAHTSVSHLIIQVSDTGTGIPAPLQNRIFEPFFTTKEVGKGTGLGLSLAYEIIQRHHGEIEFRSHPGQGTVFTVRIPLTVPIHSSSPDASQVSPYAPASENPTL